MGVFNIKTALVVSLLISWVLLGINVYSTIQILNSTNSSIPSTRGQSQSAQDILDALLTQPIPEKPSPCDRIKESQILVFDDHILINFKNAEWATFTDTNSMDPVIDTGANAIEYIPKSPDEICVGDIVSYNSNYADGVIIHRVLEMGEDSAGWYAVMKGDNNPFADPGRIRFNQIERVVVGIIY